MGSVLVHDEWLDPFTMDFLRCGCRFADVADSASREKVRGPCDNQAGAERMRTQCGGWGEGNTNNPGQLTFFPDLGLDPRPPGTNSGLIIAA